MLNAIPLTNSPSYRATQLSIKAHSCTTVLQMVEIFDECERELEALAISPIGSIAREQISDELLAIQVKIMSALIKTTSTTEEEFVAKFSVWFASSPEQNMPDSEMSVSERIAKSAYMDLLRLKSDQSGER